jgi:predicted HTH transcriptional regulator
MTIFTKIFREIDDSDLIELERNPQNFENLSIEYKLQYNGDPDELRKDIIQFANGFIDGYLLFGVKNNPIKIIGIEKKKISINKSISKLNNVFT